MMKQNWIAAFFLILASCLVYGVTLHNPYYFDDDGVIKNNSDLDSAKPPLIFYKILSVNQEERFGGYRPTLMMSYWANIRLLGKTPASIRTLNILLHTLNALLWAFIILQFFQDTRTWKIAWWSGFAFLLHPIQTLGINFLWKRSSLLENFFILAGIFLHARERNRKGPYRWWVICLQIFLFGGAITSKESGIMFPAFLLLVDLCFYRSVFKKFLPGIFTLYVPMSLIAAGFYYFRIHWAPGLLEPNIILKSLEHVRNLSPLNYCLASLTIIPRYFILWLFPRPLLFDDPISFENGWQLWMLGGVGLFVASLFAAFRFRKNPMVPFFIGTIWISLLPSISFIPIRYVMDQIRLYLPLAGMGGLLVTAFLSLQKHVRSQKLIPSVLVGALLLYTNFTLLQNLRYGNPVAIFQDVVREYPKSGIGWDNLAVAYHRTDLPARAIWAHKMAAIAEPTNPDYVLKGEMWEAVGVADPVQRKKMLMAIDVSKITAVALLVLIRSEIEIKDYEAATLHLEEAQKRFPAYAPVHLALGELWEQTGDLENARKAYANTLQLNPNNPEALAGQNRIGKPLSKPTHVNPIVNR